MLDRLADFFSSFTRALADAFAEAAHAFAQVFATANRPAVRDVFAKMFAAVPRALTCILVSVADTSMAADIAAAAPPSVRHVQDPLVLVFLIPKVVHRCSNWRDRNWTRERREKNKQ